jgi:hypothetical protein
MSLSDRVVIGSLQSVLNDFLLCLDDSKVVLTINQLAQANEFRNYPFLVELDQLISFDRDESISQQDSGERCRKSFDDNFCSPSIVVT